MKKANIYQQLVDNFQEVLFIISPDWQAVYFVNHSYEKVWGKTCESLLSDPFSWTDSLHPEDKNKILQYIEEKKQELPGDITFPDYRIIKPDNSIRWISAQCFPILDEEGNVNRIAGIASDITARKEIEMQRDILLESLRNANEKLEQRVIERTSELDQKTKSLEETNVALKILLEKRAVDKNILEEEVLSSIEKLITPYLEKVIMRCDDESQKVLLKILQSNLDEITSSFAQKHRDMLSKLTPAQIQVADLIKQGHTTKEIASLLDLSPSTIACHRQEIRKRLSLNKEKINLRAALITE